MVDLWPFCISQIKTQLDEKRLPWCESLTRTRMPSCSTGVLSYVAAHTLTSVFTSKALRSCTSKLDFSHNELTAPLNTQKKMNCVMIIRLNSTSINFPSCALVGLCVMRNLRQPYVISTGAGRLIFTLKMLRWLEEKKKDQGYAVRQGIEIASP